MTKEKKAIMDVLQSYGLKQANLTSDFAREEIADEIMKAQKEIVPPMNKKTLIF